MVKRVQKEQTLWGELVQCEGAGKSGPRLREGGEGSWGDPHLGPEGDVGKVSKKGKRGLGEQPLSM